MTEQKPQTIKITDKPHMDARIDELPRLSSAPDYVSKPRKPLDTPDAAERAMSRKAARNSAENQTLLRRAAVVAGTVAGAAALAVAVSRGGAPNPGEAPSSANFVPSQEQVNAMDPAAGENQTPPTELPAPVDQPILNDGQHGPQE